jgi:hypothetical protein
MVLYATRPKTLSPADPCNKVASRHSIGCMQRRSCHFLAARPIESLGPTEDARRPCGDPRRRGAAVPRYSITPDHQFSRLGLPLDLPERGGRDRRAPSRFGSAALGEQAPLHRRRWSRSRLKIDAFFASIVQGPIQPLCDGQPGEKVIGSAQDAGLGAFICKCPAKLGFEGGPHG